MDQEWTHKSLQDELDEEMRMLIDKGIRDMLVDPIVIEEPDGTTKARWYQPYILKGDYIEVEGRVVERKELGDGKAS